MSTPIIATRADSLSRHTPASILLIHPPVAKPSEPPAGIAKLAGALVAHGIDYSLIDANLEGMLFFLQRPSVVQDTWTLRASRSLSTHLKNLRTARLYANIDRYRRAVGDVNHLLQTAFPGLTASPSLCDYHDSRLTPVRSQDLLYSAKHPELNPFYDYMEKSLSLKIEVACPALIGISINYLSQALTGFAVAGFIRRRFPQAGIIMGGGLITSWMKNCAWSKGFSGLIDRFIAGPGEDPLLELLGASHETGDFYVPDYVGFRWKDYLSPGPVLPYASSSGCYWARCSFCPERAEGNPYRPVPVSKAVQQLRTLSEGMSPSLIHLVDNAVSPAMLKALIEHPPGAPWYGFVRTTAELTDPLFCRALRQSGCVMLKLGIESGDQKVLDYLEKGTTVEMSARALKAIHAAGISTYVYLLFGTPPETRLEAERTLAFTVAHSLFIDFLNLAIFNLPVNSPEAATLTTGGFYEGDCPLYADFVHPEGWNRLEVRRFLDKAFRRNPAIAAILRSQPPLFTSNHAPFLSIHGGLAESRKARF